MTLSQQFLSTVENGLFLSVDHYVWAPARAHGGRPRNGTGGQWSRVEETLISWHVLCPLGLVISCAGSHGLSGQTTQASSTVAKEQSSKWAGVGPSPRLQRGHKIVKVLVLKEQKVSTRNDCKQEWDFIVWLRLKCYFVCILYSRKKLVCNNKATLCLLWGGRELKRDGQG